MTSNPNPHTISGTLVTTTVSKASHSSNGSEGELLPVPSARLQKADSTDPASITIAHPVANNTNPAPAEYRQ